eukprot:1097195-Pelagomonas_calceolata.AAC.2
MKQAHEALQGACEGHCEAGIPAIHGCKQRHTGVHEKRGRQPWVWGSKAHREVGAKPLHGITCKAGEGKA